MIQKMGDEILFVAGGDANSCFNDCHILDSSHGMFRFNLQRKYMCNAVKTVSPRVTGQNNI